MALSVANSIQHTGLSGSSLTSGTFTTVAGQSVVIQVRGTTSNFGVTSITDSASNTYVQVSTFSLTSVEAGFFFLCANPVAFTGNVATAHVTNNAGNAAVFVWQIAGAGGNLTFDLDKSITGSSNTTTTASFNTQYANEIVLVANYASTGSTTYTAGNIAGSAATVDYPLSGSVFSGYEHGILAGAQTGITAAMTSGFNGQSVLFVAAFGLPSAATPTFSPNGGNFGPAQTVTITSTTSGGTIFYTTDGTAPTESSSSIANGGTVSITTTCTLKAIESASGFSDSAVRSASFTINGAVATSTFSPVAGTYSSTQSVTVSNTNSALTGFAQYYTTDGTTPTTGSTLYSGAISVSASETIKVLAVATNYSNSSIASAAYVISTGGSGIGTVLTGAAIGIKVVNSSGYDMPITSPTVTAHLGLPIPVVFCDPNGNEYTLTGATKGNFVKGPLPVCLCDPNGRPIVPPIVLTSNGNSVSITATLTGKKLGQPTPVMLTDPNGFLYTLSGFSFGTNAQRPIPVCLCDIHGNVVTMTIGT